MFLIYDYSVLGKNEEDYLNSAKKFNSESFHIELKKIFKYFPVYPYLSTDELISQIIQEYLPNDDAPQINFVKLLSQITSDLQYVCQAFQLAEYYSRQGNDVFVYEFDYKVHDSSIPPDLKDYFGLTTHGDEGDITFGYIFSKEYNSTSPAERVLSRQVMTYLSNFVKYDNPNGLNGQSNSEVS